MVAWPKITRPIELGRLGVLDLTILWTCIEATLGMACAHRPESNLVGAACCR
jgi:hypothetical protein